MYGTRNRADRHNPRFAALSLLARNPRLGLISGIGVGILLLAGSVVALAAAAHRQRPPQAHAQRVESGRHRRGRIAAERPGPGSRYTIGSSSTVTPMLVGLNGDWGEQSASDMKGLFSLDRLDTRIAEGTEWPRTYNTAGIAVIAAISGTCPTCGYSRRGVSAIRTASWARQAVSWYGSHCDSSRSNCPALEVLNEPNGSWFWGPEAEDHANANAYARLLRTTWIAFHDQFGAKAPKILGAFDDDTWGPEVWHNTAGVSVSSYVDGVVVHPYGGTAHCAGGGAGMPGDASAQGNRGYVTEAHLVTGKPVWLTEVGWPTSIGSGCTRDSEQWTYRQQAENIYRFVSWARATRYVAAITYYSYRNASDGDTQAQYGVETWSGKKKPGWTALVEAAHGQTCSAC